MIKALVGIGDIHLRKKDFFEVGIEKFEKWFDETFPNEAKENTEIILAGDIFDKIALLPSVAAEAVKLSNLFFKKAKRVYAILGNHDYGLHRYRVENSKKLLDELGFIVIDNLTTLTTENGFRVLCLPWVYNTSLGKVNEFIKQNENENFDAVCAHWELEPLFGDEFMDLSNVKTNSYMIGHIHSHNSNPKYLGSVLPNSVAEGKELDNSVIKMLCKDFDQNKSKEREVPIPSFVSISEVVIQSLEDLSSLQKDSSVFYKIFHPATITEKSVKTQAELLGLNIYSLEKIHEEGSEELNTEVEIKEYTKTGPEDLIELYAEALNITEEEKIACLQVIRSSRAA